MMITDDKDIRLSADAELESEPHADTGIHHGSAPCPHCGAGDGDECDFVNVPHEPAA